MISLLTAHDKISTLMSVLVLVSSPNNACYCLYGIETGLLLVC